MKINEFKDRIEKVYHGKFAESAAVVKGAKCLGRYITIDLYLADNSKEVFNGYMINDMFKITLWIDLPDKFDFENDELPETMTMRAVKNSYAIKPESKYLYCELKRVAYRKTAGDAEKLIKTFGKFVDRLYSQVVEDLNNGNAHENYVELLKKKIAA